MLRLPLATASTKRACPSRGKVSQVDRPLRIAHARSVARGAMACEQIAASLHLLRRILRVLRCGARAEKREAEAHRHDNIHVSGSRLAHSGIRANVVTDPPVGMRS